MFAFSKVSMLFLVPRNRSSPAIGEDGNVRVNPREEGTERQKIIDRIGSYAVCTLVLVVSISMNHVVSISMNLLSEWSILYLN
jgi:hypothetical protein